MNTGRRGRHARLALVAAVVGGAVVACGGGGLTYAGGSDSGGMYFSVPSSWHGYDAKALSTAEVAWGSNDGGKALLDSTTWQTAFDGAPTPSIDHVFANAAATAPTAYASVRTLYDAEKQATTEDPTVALRDLVLPVSTLESQGRDDFSLVTDERVQQGDFDGRHMVMRYRVAPGAPEQTVDQTAFLDKTASKVYLMVVRCTTECFEQNRSAIDASVASLTLREAHGA